MASRAISLGASHVRRKTASGTVQASGADLHLLGGTIASRVHSSYLKPDLDWDQVKQIVSATLFLTGSSAHGVNSPALGRALLRQCVGAVDFTSAPYSSGEANWVATANRPSDSTATPIRASVGATAGEEIGIDITRFFNSWAPKTVKQSSGAAGPAKPNRGIHLQVTATSHPVAFNSTHAITGQPRIVLEYVEIAGPGEVVLSEPPSVISQIDGVSFVGEFFAGALGVTASHLRIEVFGPDDEDVPVWIHDAPATSQFSATGVFTVPLPALLRSGATYNWRARVTGSTGLTTGWTALAEFELLSGAPTLSDPLPLTADLETLTGVTFTALYSSDVLADTFQIQARVSGASTWGPADLIWDSGEQTVQSDIRVGARWGGPGLGPGDYEWRIRGRDMLGAQSAWVTGAFTLSVGWAPAPGDEANITSYGRTRPKVRILIKALDIGTEEAPGDRKPLEPPIAILEDAANIGASKFHNDGGEFFFTLPSTHEQASVIEPYLTSYHLEFYTGEGWKEKTYGIITDIDSTGDETVWYGEDKMGILGRLYDERFSLKGPDVSIAHGGAKYVNQKVSFIIQDQLQLAHDLPFSPVAHIAVPEVEDWTTTIDINASFKNRLAMIASLIDSHRAGTGRRTRLSCRKLIDGTYTWDVQDSPGVDRSNIVLEYGGIVNAFEVVPFEDFATKVLGIGRKLDGSKPYFSIGHPPDSEGDGKPFPEWRYGSFPRIAVWQDIVDPHDLKRRTDKVARTAGKIGKRVGLGFKVGALGVEDGWDICDSVVVLIKRGVIDTTRYGSGYWTIEGWTWQLFPDGHDDLILSLVPRDDNFPPDTTILVDGTPANEPGAGTPVAPILDTFVQVCRPDLTAQAACQFMVGNFGVPSGSDWGDEWVVDWPNASIADGVGVLGPTLGGVHRAISLLGPWDVRATFSFPALVLPPFDPGESVDNADAGFALVVRVGGFYRTFKVHASWSRASNPTGNVAAESPLFADVNAPGWTGEGMFGEIIVQQHADEHIWAQLVGGSLDTGLIDCGSHPGQVTEVRLSASAGVLDDSGTPDFIWTSTGSSVSVTSFRATSTAPGLAEDSSGCWRLDPDLPPYHGLGAPDDLRGIDTDLYYEEDTGYEWQKAGGVWVPLYDTLDGHRIGVFPMICTQPEIGQQIVGEIVAAGDGTTVDWTTNYAYRPGSLYAYVDGLIQKVTEDDPALGTFHLAFAAAVGEWVQVTYVVDEY